MVALLLVGLCSQSGFAGEFAESCGESDSFAAIEQAASSFDEATLARVIAEIEAQFNKQGIQFDAQANRTQIVRELERLYTYFNSENDPGASKRMTYLLSLFKYARFRRVTGQQLRWLVGDIGKVLSRERLVTDLGNDARQAEGVFDMNSIMGVTEYFEMQRGRTSTTLVFKTNCRDGSGCRIDINSSALPETARQRMADNGFSLSHIVYKPTIKVEIVTGEEIRLRSAELHTLITERSKKIFGKSVGVHEMTPEAPGYLEEHHKTPQGAQPKTVPVEKQIANYVRAINEGRRDFMPLLLNLDGVALKVNWDKRQLEDGFIKNRLDPVRTVKMDSFAILPQYFGRESAYSPMVVSAVDDAVGGMYTVRVKFAR